MEKGFFPQAGFLQFEISFGDPVANLQKAKSLIHDLSPAKDAIIVLPELWAYGFDYQNAENLSKETPELLQELSSLASQFEIVLAGSLLESKEGEGIFNTLYFVGPEGVLGKYQKQHLFALWQEDSYFIPGEYFTPVATSFGKIGGLVCYDLRFPELAREQVFRGSQLIVVSAEWPRSRIDHWRTLVQARAIENQVFLLACNSCGETGGQVMGGKSIVVGPDGTVLLEADDSEEARVTYLDSQVLSTVRKRFCPPGERPRPVRDSEKCVDLPKLLQRLGGIRKQKSRIAFTNGCFDILHSGHVSYLEMARSTADYLVVGLNSDRSVRLIKGAGRPVNSQQDRARILSSLACVDNVVIFDDETPQTLISAIMPDVLVKGSDWAEEDIVGANTVRAAGGKVVRIPFEHDVSTTELISRIQSQE